MSLDDDTLMDLVRDCAADGGRWPSDWLEACRRAIKAAGEPRWQLIGTAPKDGTTILVNDTTPGWTPWVAASWLSGDVWSGWVYDDADALDSNPAGPNPTHWMPLPAPPAA